MKKRKYHHGDLKNELVKCAAEIIRRKGIDDLNIRRLTAMLSVSHTAFYRHFKNKEELLVAVAIVGFNNLDMMLEKAGFSDNGKPFDSIFTAAKTYIDFAVKNPVFYRLMFGEYIRNKTGYPDLFKAYDRAFRKLIAIITKGHTGIREKQDKGEITALAVWSMLHGYSRLVIDNAEDTGIGSDGQISLLLRIMKKMI